MEEEPFKETTKRLNSKGRTPAWVLSECQNRVEDLESVVIAFKTKNGEMTMLASNTSEAELALYNKIITKCIDRLIFRKAKS